MFRIDMDHDRTFIYFLLKNEKSDFCIHLKIFGGDRGVEFTFSIGMYAHNFHITYDCS